MFSSCCMISDVWTVSANTARGWLTLNAGTQTLEMKHHFGRIRWIIHSKNSLICPPDDNWITVRCGALCSEHVTRLLNDQCPSLFLSSIPAGVCQWNREGLQRDQVQNKVWEDMPAMDSQLPTQAEVRIHILKRQFTFYIWNFCTFS